MRRAWIQAAAGAPLELREQEEQVALADGEVLVANQALAVNPVDLKLLEAPGSLPLAFPRVPGCDGAGVVVASQSPTFKVGDRVAYHCSVSRNGSFSTHTVVDARTACRVPDGVRFVDAASLPCAAWTAYQAVDRRGLVRRGASVLVHGGSGGVGGYAVQMAVARGATAVTTCSAANAAYARELGASLVVDYRAEDAREQLAAAGPFDVVINTVSADSAARDLGLLACNGRLVCVMGLPSSLESVVPFRMAPTISEVALGSPFQVPGADAALEDIGRIGAEVFELMEAGLLRSAVSQPVRGFEELPEALEALRARSQQGKVVVRLHPI